MGLRRSVLRAIENATIAPATITDLWDGTEVTADVNNSAVTTGDAEFTAAAVGTAQSLYRVDPAGQYEHDEVFQATLDVSTSAKTILDTSDMDLTGNASGLLFVTGRDDGATNTIFYDLVAYINDATVTVVASDGDGMPAGRTYSLANGRDLQLAMASGSYNVMASGPLHRPEVG